MIDPRFYEVSGPLSASDIAASLGASVVRGDAARQRLIGRVRRQRRARRSLPFSKTLTALPRVVARRRSAWRRRCRGRASADGPTVIEARTHARLSRRLPQRLVAPARARAWAASDPSRPRASTPPQCWSPASSSAPAQRIGAGRPHRRQCRHRPRRPDRRAHDHRRQRQHPLRPDRRWRHASSRAW